MVYNALASAAPFVLMTTVLCAQPAAVEAPASTELREIAEPLLTPLIDAELTPSLAVAVRRGDVVEHFGLGALPDGTTPTPDTLYEIGSISKVLTAMLLADAARAGDLTLETTVNELLPDGVELASRDDEPVRLWHLATHTSGMLRMPANFAPGDPTDPFADYTEVKLLEELASTPLASTPGTRYAYSNLGAGLLGWIVARELGTPYEDAVRARVLTPLGMQGTLIEMNDAANARLAPPTDGYKQTNGWYFQETTAGAGAWRSGTRDLMRLAERVLDPQDDPIDDTIARTLEVRFDPAEHGQDAPGTHEMGLGWHLAGDGSTWWHTGMTGAYATTMLVNPELDIAVIVLANAPVGVVSAVGEQVVRALAGMDEQPMSPRQHKEVDAKDLDRLVGTYTTQVGFDITITRVDRALYAQLTGQPAFRVFPESPTRFFYRAAPAELGFDLPEDDAGHATAITLYQNGMEFKGVREE